MEGRKSAKGGKEGEKKGGNKGAAEFEHERFVKNENIQKCSKLITSAS